MRLGVEIALRYLYAQCNSVGSLSSPFRRSESVQEAKEKMRHEPHRVEWTRIGSVLRVLDPDEPVATRIEHGLGTRPPSSSASGAGFG
jgi:hypothetical protein